MVAKATPNVYTLLAAFSSQASNAALYTNLRFDAVNDFAPITLIIIVPNILVVNPSLPVKTVRELITLANKYPREILYASIGPGSPAHLSAELFNSMAGIKMRHVPYKGGPPTIIASVSGETHLTITTTPIVVSHIKASKLRAIAVASLKRAAIMPQVPTIDESGLPGYESTAWHALLASAKTPHSTIEKLHREAMRTLQLADVRESLLQQGAESIGGTPEQLGALIKADI